MNPGHQRLALVAALHEEWSDWLAQLPDRRSEQVAGGLGPGVAMVRTITDRADDDAHTDFSRFLRDCASLYSQAVLKCGFT